MHTPQASETADVSESYNASPLLNLLPLPECADPDTVDALPEAEVSYQALFEFHPHPMWITEYDTLRFLLVNETAIKHYGYSEAEFLSMTLKDICPPEDFPAMLQSRMAKLPQKGQLGIWRHIKKNEEIIHVEVTARDFRFQGRSARLALVNDITERRKAEEALKQSEQAHRQSAEHLAREKERLALAQSVAKVGSWEIDLTTRELTCSDETYRIFGLGTDVSTTMGGAFLARVHPDDRAAVQNSFRESIDDHVAFGMDYRMQMPDGSIKFVHARCRTIYDAADNPLQSVGTVQDLTDQRQTEQALHHILEGAHCLLWTSEVEEIEGQAFKWDMHFASEQAAQRFIPLQIQEGRHYGDAWYLARPLEDRMRTDVYGEQAIRAGKSYQQEFRTYSKHGTLHWLSENVHVQILGEGRWRCTGVCTDITERKLAEEATRAMTRGAQCLLWYAVVEERPRGLHWSLKLADEEAAKEFFPVAQPEEISYGEALVRARLSEDNTIMDARSTEALRGGKQGYTNQFRCLRVDGEWRWMNETVRIEALEPGRWRCVGVCTDFTDQKRAEEQRDRLLTAKQEADLANQAKSAFLSRMSHELRTPLNAILGFGQILAQQPLNALQVESVQYILKGGRHLLDLINEVLDIARVESGQIDLSLEAIPTAELVAESCLLLRPLAAERHIFLDADAASFGRRHVLADHQRLKQVLINLLSNAIKYNRTGGQVRIYGLPAREGRLRIAIQDTGLGMTPKEQQKLFTPFERLSAAHSEVEGTGLGLVLSQRLVNAMGGSLTLDSVPGEGTTFFIELPSVPPPEEALALNLHPIEALQEASPAERISTILTIEDNPSNLRLLEVLLRSRPGTTLLVAMQGSIGLDLARQHRPDLILLDLNLPDIPGREVLARLRASDRTHDIPVIVLSADATSSQIERLLEAGAQAYLTKPLDVAEFMDTLDTMLPNPKAP